MKYIIPLVLFLIFAQASLAELSLKNSACYDDGSISIHVVSKDKDVPIEELKITAKAVEERYTIDLNGNWSYSGDRSYSS